MSAPSIEVINSFKQVGGRLAQGLEYDIRFNRRMNKELTAATASTEFRRILLYDYVNQRLLPYLNQPNVFAVRYERWFLKPDVLLKELSNFLGRPLTMGHVRIRHSEKAVAITEQEKQ
ncbi:MAG: hypothetical protein R2867_16975 [Caldilineaceae bacterium]